MKHKFLHLQSLVSVALCIIMAMTFTGCSDNDEEPTGDELTSIIVGVWAQDGDNDIFVVNANGTGEVYGSPELYEQKKDGASFVWTYKDGWVKAGIAGVQEEEMRAHKSKMRRQQEEQQRLDAVSYTHLTLPTN